jgi:hypothetical protein
LPAPRRKSVSPVVDETPRQEVINLPKVDNVDNVVRSGLDISQQLAVLRGICVPRRQLHQAQVDHLVGWCYVVDPGLREIGQEPSGVEISVDFTGRMVDYIWRSAKKPLKIDQSYVVKLVELEKSVRFLLGQEWKTTVVRDGVRILPRDGGGASTAGGGRLADWWRRLRRPRP